MQSDHKEIYRLTAARTGKKENIYKDIGSFVLKTAYDALKAPPSLLIKLKGVGYWYLRKQRMEKTISMYPPGYAEGTHVVFDTERAFLDFLDRRKLYDLFVARLKDYDRYVEKKADVKKRAHEFKEAYKCQKEGIPSGPDQF